MVVGFLFAVKRRSKGRRNIYLLGVSWRIRPLVAGALGFGVSGEAFVL